jgi:uncharacterized protein YkwD
MRARSILAVVLVALVAAFVVPLVALVDDSHAAVELSSKEKTLIDLINKQRTKRGLAKVSAQASLMSAARAHSGEMGLEQYFSHDSANGETFARRLIRHGFTKRGYSFWKVGEDIYYGSGLYSTPSAAVRAWMRSSAHRAVILTRCFRKVGVGIVVCEEGYRSIDQPVTFFTLDLGRRFD